MPDRVTKRSRNIGSKPKKTAAEKLAEKQAKEASEKASQGSQTGQQSVLVPSNPTTSQQAQTLQNSSLVPGLKTLSIADVGNRMTSTFNPENYAVTDALKPPESLPNLSDGDFEGLQTIYKGAINASKAEGLNYDLKKEVFVTQGKEADAFGAGIKTATKFEKVKGEYFDYQSQLETNKQKESDLGVAQYNTVQGAAKATYLKTITEESVNQARINSELAKTETLNKQKKLIETQARYGQQTIDVKGEAA